MLKKPQHTTQIMVLSCYTYKTTIQGIAPYIFLVTIKQQQHHHQQQQREIPTDLLVSV